jgi:hypothetical protein
MLGGDGMIAFAVAIAMAYLFVCFQVWLLRQYVNAMYEEQRVRAKMFAKELREVGERLSAVEGEPTDVDDDSEVELTAVTVPDLEQWHAPRMECEP